MKKSKLDETYRLTVSPNGVRRGVFDIFSAAGAIFRTVTGVQDIRDGFAEEERRHKVRRANMIRNIFR